MRFRLALSALMVACGIAAAEPPSAPAQAPSSPATDPQAAQEPQPAQPRPASAGVPATESVQEALCRLIDTAARDHGVPAAFLTNLIWRESSFRRDAVSRKGAQGIAQFMPYTAAERGLGDPFDPEEAIPHAARLIADLAARFGNLGLAAAAYNAGAGRVEKWLTKQAGLPAETRNFVVLVTGRSAEEWAALREGKPEVAPIPAALESCATIIVALRRPGRGAQGTGGEPVEEAPFAPWGVQLAGNFSKERALAQFAQARRQYAAALGEVAPMIIGTRLRSRGTAAFYRVRVPAETRPAAEALCRKIHAMGGSCVVLRS